MPFRLPLLQEDELQSLISGTFHDGVSGMLNLLFGTKLTAWDVSCCIGRHSVRLESLGRKTLVAELWHNPDGSFPWLTVSLAKLLRGASSAEEEGNWMDIAVRMAVLCGILAQLQGQKILSGEESVDISLSPGDFSWIMGAWYARKLGLPVGRIIVCCNENSVLWEYLHQGQLRLDRLEGIPVGVERLIYECGGPAEVARFLDVSRAGGIYCTGELEMKKIRTGLCASVVGKQRVQETVANVLSSRQYVLSRESALAFAGLQDHRVISGETRIALVTAEQRCEISVHQPEEFPNEQR